MRTSPLYADIAQMASTPSRLVRAVKWLALLFFILPVLALFLPWQQNVTATGQVTAFSPTERAQMVDAPVSGVINHWHVQEGGAVKKGDLLLELSDIDPQFKARLESQRDNFKEKLNAKESERNAYQQQQQNLMASRDAKISAAQFKLDIANQKILSTSESISAAQAASDTASLQASRLHRLFQEGLVSKRDLEVAERDQIIANRTLNTALAQHQAAKAEAKSAMAEIQQIRADTQATLVTNQAIINKLDSELADSKNSLTGAEINVSRQSMQKVYAPRDGTVFRLPVNTQSEIVSQGQPLLTIVPETKVRAVALWVDGRDAPLIVTGSHVRLEFEGWPAIQVSGWPNMRVGTFAGKVAFVDPTDNGTGNFRVMVVPKSTQEPWPEARFLRQGMSARGWILLEKVSIGYEIWRILNGFPPRIPQEPISVSK